MKTFTAFAALALAAVVAAPAGAKTTDEVRVSITGKNSVQIENEIKAAADSVCAGASKAAAQECVDSALSSARRQLAMIMRARETGKALKAETVSVVRISLKGKTLDQIHTEIRSAAATVCRAQPNFSAVTYQACVADTVRAAKAQLTARDGAAV